MKIKTLPNKKAIVVDGGLNLYFSSAIDNFLTENDSSLKLTDKMVATFQVNEKSLELNVNNQSVSSNVFTLKIDYDMLLEVNSNNVSFSKNNLNYVIHGENILFDINNEGVFIVRFSDNIKMILCYYEDYFIKSKSFIANVTTIDENTYLPEFSISVFDDDQNTFLKPRPIRQGVPIVSTVPSFVNSNSSASDLNFYESGKGPDKKKLYFRIICNKVMENLSPNSLSAMRLKIYMPNGLDTVKTAIYRPMYLKSNDTTNGISIYYADHDFYIQGNFGGIDYVDGYMYCDVDVPLTVTRTITAEFDFILYDL